MTSSFLYRLMQQAKDAAKGRKFGYASEGEYRVRYQNKPDPSFYKDHQGVPHPGFQEGPTVFRNHVRVG